jgi:hypothetical protein
MGRDRCLFCDRFIFEGEDVTRPASLGLTVHRHCYRRDAGLEPSHDAGGFESIHDVDQHSEEDVEDSGESSWREAS